MMVLTGGGKGNPRKPVLSWDPRAAKAVRPAVHNPPSCACPAWPDGKSGRRAGRRRPGRLWVDRILEALAGLELRLRRFLDLHRLSGDRKSTRLNSSH